MTRDEMIQTAVDLAPLCAKLYEAGFIGFPCGTSVQVSSVVFPSLFQKRELTMVDSDTYPYEYHAKVNGVDFFCVSSEAL